MTSTVTAVNQAQSLAAIRNFVRASVSCITYARGLCSDNAFEQRPFLGIPLRQLIPSTPESVMISEWIEKGAFDALNRGYLKEMSLCVYDADCRELLESYCFGFNYSGDGQRAQMTLNASQSIDGAASAAAPSSQRSGGAALAVPKYRRRRCTKQEVQLMLTAILERLMDVVETLPPLLSERVLTMRLTYYDVTPAAYEPPCFSPASQHMKRLYQDEVQCHVHIGAMDTSHHLFSVAIRHPLLQQIRSQLQADSSASSITGAAQTQEGDRALNVGAAAGAAAARQRSEPLRSGIQSTFSSEAATAARVALTDAANHPPQQASMDPTCDSSAGNERGAAADSPGLVVRRAESLQTEDVAGLEGVYRLVGEPRPLSLAERTYLLFAAFVFTCAPNARGGRGRLSGSELGVYRTQHCPYEVNAATAQLFLQRLASEGFLHDSEHSGDAQTPKVPRVSLHDASTRRRPTEWVVPDPPAPVLQLLLQCEVVTQLLTHDSHLVLQELCVYLVREEVRQAAKKDVSQGRLSVTDGHRKRR